MKNLIKENYMLVYRKVIKLLLLLFLSILTFQLFATSKLQEDAQNDSFNWQVQIDSELINTNLNIKGDDIIFINGFESEPIILGFTANPTTVNSGESSTITWTLANNVTTCTKSGDWTGNFTGSEVTNGSHSLLVENITSNSTFNLICVNSVGSSLSSTVIVLVNNGSPDCSTQPPILNGDEDFTIRLIPGATGGQQGTPSNPATYDGTYDDIAPGSGWPGVLGTQSFFNLTSNKYIAMQFSTDNTNAIAKLVFTPPGNGQGPPSTATTVSISECPGDFTTHLNQARCLRIGGAIPNLRWSQNPDTNTLTHCKLEINRIYYLNIVHSNDVENDYKITDCTSTNCGAIFSHTNEQN